MLLAHVDHADVSAKGEATALCSLKGLQLLNLLIESGLELGHLTSKSLLNLIHLVLILGLLVNCIFDSISVCVLISSLFVV